MQCVQVRGDAEGQQSLDDTACGHAECEYEERVNGGGRLEQTGEEPDDGVWPSAGLDKCFKIGRLRNCRSTSNCCGATCQPADCQPSTAVSPPQTINRHEVPPDAGLGSQLSNT